MKDQVLNIGLLVLGVLFIWTAKQEEKNKEKTIDQIAKGYKPWNSPYWDILTGKNFYQRVIHQYKKRQLWYPAMGIILIIYSLYKLLA